MTGAEQFDFATRVARCAKIEATRLRKTRCLGKYAMQLAEIEIVRAD